MKKFKSKYIIGIIFVCIIAFFFGSVCYRVYRVKRYNDYGTVTSETDASGNDKQESYDWASEYTFSEKYDCKTVKSIEKSSDKESTAEKNTNETSEKGYLSVAQQFKDSVDYYTSMLIPGRMRYVEANALFNKWIGMKIITGSDSVVAMKNGYLTFENNYKIVGDNAANSLKWFSDILKEKGIDFAYIQYPAKEDPNNNQLPEGIEDNSNLNADTVLNKLDQNGVKYLDMRTLLSEKEGNWYENFFKTDHHWKPETGVWASGKIIDMLNNDFGYNFDDTVGDLNNYNIDVYEKYCLGSQGRVATLRFADPEDISIIYPKKETDFSVQYDNNPIKNGSFEDVFFDLSRLNKDYYNNSAYAAYLYGTKPITRIKNNNCSNGKRLLIIGDSYNCCVVPYLALSIEQVDIIDRRYFDGSIINYIEKTNPDIVLSACTPTEIDGANHHRALLNFE